MNAIAMSILVQLWAAAKEQMGETLTKVMMPQDHWACHLVVPVFLVLLLVWQGLVKLCCKGGKGKADVAAEVAPQRTVWVFIVVLPPSEVKDK